MLDEEGNPDIDEVDLLDGKPDAVEDGWDVSIAAAEMASVFAGVLLQVDDDLALPADVDVRAAFDARLVADHVAAGAFDSAARLLQDQLGIVRIEPFKQHFLTAFAGPVLSRTAFEGLPSAGSNFAYPLRNWQESSGKNGLPALGLHLGDLANQVCVAEAQQLIDICREYLVGLLLETARKELPKDMSCTTCHPVHQILTLRTAINLCFKLKQMKTTKR
uniref:Coatomer alpha subunit C-terminal domain-containing protein n=1 Tax=Parascaris equorum TaxID=6256 RepID=A0A914R8F4_PAREQ